MYARDYASWSYYVFFDERTGGAVLLTEKTSGFLKRLQTVCLGAVILLCISCLAVSYVVPRPSIETLVKPDGIVKVIRAPEDSAIHKDDVIRAVNGRPVSTYAELNYLFAKSNNEAKLTIRRYGTTFTRPINAASFAGTDLPAGLTQADKPIYISFGDTYTPLINVEIAQLKAILEENQKEYASVVFERPFEEKTVTVELHKALGRTITLSCILLFVALMAFVWMRTLSRNEELRGCRINLVLAFAASAIFWASLGTTLLAMPLLFLLGMIGMTLFKAFDIDFHLHDGGKHVDFWTRTGLFLAPTLLIIAPIIMCASEMPMYWGATLDPHHENRLNAFTILPYLLVIAYTLIDAGISAYRIYRGRKLIPRDIALFVATLAACAALFLIWSDPSGTRWIVVASIVIQCFGDTIECLAARNTKNEISFNDDLFSAEPIREALKEADEILGGNWVVQAVIDRPEPHHVVGIALGTDETNDLNGLSLNILSQTWRDFLEIYRTDGMDDSAESPAKGIADRLGIVCVLPIAEKIGGSMTQATLLVSTREMPDQNAGTPLSPSVSQREALRTVADQLAASEIALVYLCAEMSIEFLGDDLDEIAARVHESAALPHETASFPRSLHDPTVPLKASEIPHGLLDEDDITPDEDPAPATTHKQNADDYSTKVFEEEMNLLKSQVLTLCSQQMRAFSLDEIEFTKAQSAVLDDIKSLETPIIIAGERGTGKTMLALSAHQSHSSGPFLQIDAADLPETILAINMFGDSENAGLIKSAVGGSLLIKNVDRLSTAILSDIMEAIDNVASEGTFDLYMTITLRDEEVSTVKYERDPRELPARCRDLAEHCDAEIVYIQPIREQSDILNVAEFFMQRQAMRMEKTVLSLDQNAQKAITVYRWPGNIHELRSVIERAVLRTSNETLSLDDLGADFERLIDSDTRNAVLKEADIIQEQLEHAQQHNQQLQFLVDRLNERIRELEAEPAPVSDNTLLDGEFDDVEKRLLTRLLNKYQNDPEVAVAALNTNRTKFFNKLRKYNLL